MSKKFLHYALKTNDGYLVKDTRDDCLQIFETLEAAEISSQGMEIVPCYIYSAKERQAISERIEGLEQWIAAIADDHNAIPDWIQQSARSILGNGASNTN